HLVEPRHLTELALERCRDGRRRHVRARAGVEGEHLDRRIVDLRQRRHGQLAVRGEADEDEPGREERGGDRAQDEDAGGIHAPGAGIAPAAGRSCTTLPARSLSTPSTTTTSSGTRPVSTTASSPSCGPTVTGRTATVRS